MKSTFAGRDILSLQEFTRADITAVLRQAKQLKKKPQPKLLDTMVLGSCFFEPSTRTRLSFETAMQRLGGRVVGFADANVTSTKKGETLHDTIKIVGQYTDAIVIRHPLDGAARRAAEATDKPVINAGDGSNQHPTQTLLDLFTIEETQKKLDGLKIAFVGDLKYGRTVHSLVQALTHYNARIYCVAPESLQLPQYLLAELREHRLKVSLHERIEEVIKNVDIVYLTRIQSERFPDPTEYDKVKHIYRLTPHDLLGVKKNLKILHPLPRITELDQRVDDTPYASYFEQAHNGLFVRQAVLGMVLGKL